MTSALQLIGQVKQGDLSGLKTHPWLKYLALAEEVRVNLERVDSLEELKRNYILNYVERSLKALAELQLPGERQSLLEEVLVWSEVAKGGMQYQRKRWAQQGVNLFVHNLGSAQIYEEEVRRRREMGPRERLVKTLIATHGLVGQYLRGEAPLHLNQPLNDLVSDGIVTATELRTLLAELNYCVIQAVSPQLWREVAGEIAETIERIVAGDYSSGFSLEERLRRLRSTAIGKGENFDREYEKLVQDERMRRDLETLLTRHDLWYVEAALNDFSLAEFVKILLMVRHDPGFARIGHLSFEKMMRELYYQYEGRKQVNVYKKRVIEKYLAQHDWDEIMAGIHKPNPHVRHWLEFDRQFGDTAFFCFEFSPAGNALIDFCIEAQKADLLYERAVVLLFDLFELRKDAYDRFHEEQKYLTTMNQGVEWKKIILDYIQGERILDIGPGGGVMLDLVEQTFPGKQVIGIDISQNVIDALQKKQQAQGRKWQVMFGDALNLPAVLAPGSIDTIIFSSIIHELYSYIEYEGQKFNSATIAAALRSAFEVLAPGGRIIIRDGIMTEPEEQQRIIRFSAEDGMEFLKRYAYDFQGRKISYERVGLNEVRMPVNDAMEFLYTYTWGEQSYVHEINEQFGYFTPSKYRAFIEQTLGETATIIEARHFLQAGYTTALASKIEFFDEQGRTAVLPDSTCLIVIQKNSAANKENA